MFCSACGVQAAEGTTFCANCSQNIGAQQQLSTQPKAGSNSQSINFGQAISICFSKYADFKGRASRPEYWWFYLFSVLLCWGAMIVDHSQILSGLVNLVFLPPALSAGTRRLHDTNRSGWWQLIALTVIGVIPLLIWLASEGDHHANDFGSPL